MKKKAYKAINVNKINIESLLDKNNGEKLIFGIDIAKNKNYCCLMNVRQEVLTTVKWLHPFQTEEFFNFVEKFPEPKIIMEPSGSYGDPILYMSEQIGIEVYRVSPKRSHDAAEVYDGVASLHDAKCAGIIAKLHLDGASEKWGLKSDYHRDLNAAIKTSEMLYDQYAQNANRLEGLMARHWPEINKYLKFRQTTFLKLVSSIGGAEQVAANKTEAYNLMKKVGGHFLSVTKIDNVIKTSETTIGVPMTAGELSGLTELAARTLELKKAVSKSKRKIEDLSQNDAVTKNLSEVVGKATAAVLITSCGSPLEYTTCNHWLKSFGLNLKEKSSGNYKGHLMISKRGSGRGRKWLYFTIMRLIQSDQIINSWYQKKIQRDGGIKKKGLIAIMRKLVKALWYVARGDKFDSSKLFDTSKLNISKA